MMDVQLLRQADFILSKCGRPMPPQAGVSVVYIPKAFLLQAVVPVQSTQTFSKEITGDTTWCLRAISTTVSAALALYVQVQLPNGRYLFNGLVDVTQIGGYGSYRYLFTRELPCPAGSKVQVTLDTSTPAAAEAQPIVILAEGAYAYYLTCNARGALSVAELASSMPRYLGTVNQNILAPCWASGEGPRTPDGYEDARYIYSSAVVSFASVTSGQLQSTAVLQIRQDSDFECRRFLVDIIAAAGVTAGAVLARVRLTSGYQLTDDFIDLAKYLGSTPWAKDFHCPAGDEVVFEFLVVDGAGSGALTVQVHMDGVRRKVAA
jgi:hypothetical protein